jgi:GT2 family glycosyltransferase
VPALPSFTVVVPTHSRPHQLAACLSALAALEYPRTHFDAVIVDDGSVSAVAPVVDRFGESLDLTLIRQARAGQSAARNAGAMVARGDYLAFTDDDCAPAPDWLRAFAGRLLDHPASLIGGRTLNALDENPFSTASQVIVDVVYRYYNTNPEASRFFATNNMSVPAEAFRSLGGFDASFRASEDRDLCDRWLMSGRPMMYAANARVFHSHALTLPAFCRQHFHYGRGAFRYHRARARRGTGRLRQDFDFYFRLPRLMTTSLSCLPPARALRVSLLAPIWQSANAAGFAWEGLRHLTGTSADGLAPSRIEATGIPRDSHRTRSTPQPPC